MSGSIMKWCLAVLLVVSCQCLSITGQIIVTPDQSIYTVDESIGDVRICLSIDASMGSNSTQNITLNIDTNPIQDGAIVNEDYVPFPSSVSGDDSDSTLCFNISIIDDNDFEPTESINITLSTDASDSMLTINGTNIIVAIQDNDGFVEPSRVTYTGREESGTIEICFMLTISMNRTGMFTLRYTQNDSESDTIFQSDYFLVTSDNVLYMNGIVDCNDFDILDDNRVEGTEITNITVTSSDPSISVIPGYVVVIIEDNDILDVTNDNTSLSLTEGESSDLCFTVTNAGAIDISFNISSDQPSNNSDYSISNYPLMFAPSSGPVTRCMTIEATSDATPEGEETFVFEWTISYDDSTFSSSDRTIVTIAGDLTPSIVNESSITVSEGESFPVCVELDGVATVQLNYSFTLVSGTAGSGDYSPSSGIVSIDPGTMMSCVSISIIEDDLVEGVENFTISFPALSDLIVDITDNDVGCVGFNQSMVSVNENVGVYSFQLVSTCAEIADGFYVSVTYRNGTALAGRDFSFTYSNPVYWGVSAPPTFNLSVNDNNVVGDEKMFSLLLTVEPSGLDINTSISELQVTITDNDQSIIGTPKDVTYRSEGEHELCFNHTNQLSTGTYSLSYTAVGGAAGAGTHFTLPTSGTVNLPIQPLTPTCIRVQVLDRDMMSFDGSFTIQWSYGSTQGLVLANDNTTVYISIFYPTMTTPTTPSQTPVTTTTSPSPSSTSTSTPILGIGIYPVIGIIVGVVALGVCFLLLLVCVICCVRVRMNRQGFYETNEDKGEAPQMLRYSASLRSLQSQTVMPADSREKENEYMV